MSKSKPSPNARTAPECGPRVGKPFIPDLIWPRGEVPECVLASPRLSVGSRLCYVVMARLGRISGKCYASEATIAKMLSRTERQVRRYLDELSTRRYIRGKQRFGLSTVWLFLWHRSFPSFASSGADKSVRVGRTKTSGHPGHKCPGGADKNVRLTPTSNPRTEPQTTNGKSTAGPPAQLNAPELARALHEILGRPDPQAAAQIAAGCRVNMPDVTDEELATFTRAWLPQLAAQKSLKNPLGLLISRMPTWVPPAVTERRQRIDAERAAAMRRIAEERMLYQAMADDPKSHPDDREFARQMLASL